MLILYLKFLDCIWVDFGTSDIEWETIQGRTASQYNFLKEIQLLMSPHGVISFSSGAQPQIVNTYTYHQLK